jgi:hypothetical protein
MYKNSNIKNANIKNANIKNENINIKNEDANENTNIKNENENIKDFEYLEDECNCNLCYTIKQILIIIIQTYNFLRNNFYKLLLFFLFYFLFKVLTSF